MLRRELALALRTLPFLDAQADAPEGYVQLTTKPALKLLVWQPDALEWIFRSDHRLDHPGSRSMRPVLGPKSLLWLDGPRYEAYRRLLGPQLGARRLGDYHSLIEEAADRAVTELTPGTVFALPEWTRRVTLDIAGRILLGNVENGVLDAFTTWLDRALGSPYRSLLYRAFKGGLPRSEAWLDRELVRSARATAPPALASLLVAPGNPLGAIDDDELRDQIVSLLFAGHETTASATAWTLYWLDRHDRLRHDVLTELSSTTDSGADAKAVPLLQATVQESLRITPPVPAAGNRTLPEATELLGRTLPRGSVVSPSIYLAHRQPDYFPAPQRFDPGRFLGTRPLPQRYLPFGGGSRHCLGSQLGQLEVRIITATLLRRRVLRCVNPSAGVPTVRGHAMAPSGRLRMEVTACHD
ncbi:cytochrome [Prauserella coralliicola]|nr:cytochrome [Prauserella coralliicola]